MALKLLDVINEAFGFPVIIVILLCGIWSDFMLGKALEEQGLKKEAKIANWGGKIYIIFAILIYALLKIYSFF